MDDLMTDGTSKFEKCGKGLRDFLHNPLKREEHTVYQYQIDAAQAMYINLGGNWEDEGHENALPYKVGMIVGPTACGKSGIINLLPYYLEAKRVLILTPSKVISQQIEQSFGVEEGFHKCFFRQTGIFKRDGPLADFLEPVVLMRDTKSDANRLALANLVIVNAQKFGGRSNLSLTHENQEIVKDAEQFFKKFDLLIVDEAHHYPAKTWKNIVDTFGKRVEGMKPNKIVFLTATPVRLIKGEQRDILFEYPEWQKKIFKIEEQLCTGITTRPCEFFEPTHDYNDCVPELYKDMEEIFRRNQALAPELDVMQQALVLVRTIDEAYRVVALLNFLVPSYAVAIVSKADKANLEKFTRGEFRVGITCGIGTEGYDNANITLCVILRPIRTGRVLFSQFVGRCMRLKRVNRQVDKYKGYVLSYRQFDQRKLWDAREFIADDGDDPVEVKDEDLLR